MLIVVALGGNALLQRDQPMTAEVQRENAHRAALALARLAAAHQVLITHGNGPQIGLLALQQVASPHTPTYPLDVLGAQTQGLIGYVLEQELRAVLPDTAPIATLLTLVEVDLDDPAFQNPTKFIGPSYAEAEACRLSAEHGWAFKQDGTRWRRVVPSPQPKHILPLQVIRWMVERSAIVICTGGGGIPVARTADGGWMGVEAVIDKDLASALLAREVGAEMLIIATESDGVYLDYGTSRQSMLRRTTPAHLRQHLHHFPPGSMGPKVQAAIDFVEHTGRPAVIGALADLDSLLSGSSGTWVEAASNDQ
ncbi:MAG: carbamate kinase [Anaerolineae bacterium]|nr:carbamate kinase [Thermoflexales bacterium]MDW8396816.1 carbamate kinase [Anaerolineae bacterium]